jgi:hypothetical protein
MPLRVPHYSTMMGNIRNLQQSDRTRRIRWAVVLVTAVFATVVLVWLVFFNYSFSEFESDSGKDSQITQLKDKISEFLSVSGESLSIVRETVSRGFEVLEDKATTTNIDQQTQPSVE